MFVLFISSHILNWLEILLIFSDRVKQELLSSLFIIFSDSYLFEWNSHACVHLCIVLWNWFYIVIPAMFLLFHLANFMSLLLCCGHGESSRAHRRKHRSLLKTHCRFAEGSRGRQVWSEERDLVQILHRTVNFLRNTMLVTPIFLEHKGRVVEGTTSHRILVQ